MGPYFILVTLSFCGVVELYLVPPTGIISVGIIKEIALPNVAQSVANPKNCDSSGIPALDEFDARKFSGTWYEIAKTVSGNIDTNDSVWKIIEPSSSNEDYKFLFSGRESNTHCIRPITGIMRSSDANPGVLTFKYRTYSSYVSENLRVLFTDYVSIAILYACAHTNSATNSCHPAGLFGAIWTRRPHVDVKVFDSGAKYLQKACIDKSTLQIRTLKGPCRIEDLGTRDDSFPVPNFCYHAVDVGSCSAKFSRFYYSYEDKECKEFTYSGCGGNNNNFLQKRECENQCIGTSIDPSCENEAPCALSCPPCCNSDENGCVKCSCSSVIVDPPFIDHCLDNPDECPNECRPEQVRDGCYHCICEGNFIPREDGREEPASVCLEAKDKGVCGKRQIKYYYNVISGNCEKFNYTGCGGNENNFPTIVDCEVKCKGAKIFERTNPVLTDGDPNCGSTFGCLLNLLNSLLLVIALNWLK